MVRRLRLVVARFVVAEWCRDVGTGCAVMALLATTAAVVVVLDRSNSDIANRSAC